MTSQLQTSRITAKNCANGERRSPKAAAQGGQARVQRSAGRCRTGQSSAAWRGVLFRPHGAWEQRHACSRRDSSVEPGLGQRDEGLTRRAWGGLTDVHIGPAGCCVQVGTRPGHRWRLLHRMHACMCINQSRSRHLTSPHLTPGGRTRASSPAGRCKPRHAQVHRAAMRGAESRPVIGRLWVEPVHCEEA